MFKLSTRICVCLALICSLAVPLTAQRRATNQPVAQLGNTSIYDVAPLSFKAHHGRFGAWSGVTFGQWWSGGGIINSTSARPVPFQTPIQIAVHVSANEGWRSSRLLPFTPTLPSRMSAFAQSQIQRDYRLATDEWSADNFKFRVLTPFAKLASLEQPKDVLRLHLAPLELIELEYDNTRGANDTYLFLGLGATVKDANTNGTRKTLSGEAWALSVDDKANRVTVARGRDVAETFNNSPKLQTANEGETGGMSFLIPKGERATYTLILAHYTKNEVVKDPEANKSFRYFYTTLFDSIDDVTNFGLSNISNLKRMTTDADNLLANSNLNAARKFIVAHGVRSYIGNSALLTDGARTLFVELEGEYQFYNTLDLIADHCFFTAEIFPFALKNQLDWYADSYSYTDQTKRYGSTELYDGGISFTHDMGSPPRLAARGTSAYEKPNIDPYKDPPGVFSFMTLEELTNWTLSAFVYWNRTGDAAWLRSRQQLLNQLLVSFINRDDSRDQARDGLPSLDSSKTGTGAEITTYDSLAPDLAIAVDSSYIAVKAWASQLALARMLEATGDTANAARARTQTGRAARSILTHWNATHFPARFTKGNRGVALPTIEGIAHLMNDAEAMRDPSSQQLINRLARHGNYAWTHNRQARGIALADSDSQIWLSKLAINQAALEHLTKRLMPAEDDRRHASNIYTNGADEPYGDNWDAVTGQRLQNVRNYPRGAAAWIWLNETPTVKRNPTSGNR